MPTDYATWGSMVRPNDIIVVWELTNDLNANSATAQVAYDNMNNYALTLRNAGAYVVGLTCIARDSAGLSANFDTRRTACNSLLLASSNFHEIIDVASLPEFNAIADCSNTTYYNADKVHLTQAGYELIADAIYGQLASKM
jgi:lysophospholipase L1-like esterase